MPLGLDIAGEIVPLREDEALEPPIHQVRSTLRMRESHHAVARLVAQGHRDFEISKITGYSIGRLAGLRRDPMFQELVAGYRHECDVQHTEFTEYATQVARDLLQSVHEDVLDLPYIDPREKAEIFKIVADRAGFAPIQRSVSKNLNVSVAERMDAATRRKKDAI